jgi:hypothetical protein
MPSFSFLRPRFSLRALLVVMTLFALFFGYHWNWIRQRRSALETGWIIDEPNPFLDREPVAPGLLPLFGEKGHSGIQVRDNLGGDRQIIHRHAKSLFPEAKLIYDADLDHELP